MSGFIVNFFRELQKLLSNKKLKLKFSTQNKPKFEKGCRSHAILHNCSISVCILVLVSFLQLPSSINANKPPQFVLNEGQSEIVLRLKEGKETPVGSLIYTLKGFDFEDDPLTFSLRGQIANEVLQIENLGNDEAHLYLKKELDREVEAEYMFVVYLTDGNLPEGNYVSQSLLILVDDINDSTPTFLSFNSTIQVPENSNVPFVLTKVEAVDRDEGPNGQVVYKLETEPGDQDMFAVNGHGEIKLLQPLDYEKKFIHQIKVLAIDRAISEKKNTATAVIVVAVTDLDDTPPYFLNFQPVTRIPEDVAVGTHILQVTAVDGDRQINNPIKYTLLNINDQFGVDEQTGIIFTKTPLDREDVVGGSYILKLLATEQSRARLKSSVSTEITVIITDVNDERPTFRNTQYQAEIVENSPAHVPLTFLGNSNPECFDYDLGLNGTFRLYTKGDGNLFEVAPAEGINSVSFHIKVKNPARLDYEKLKVVNLTLVCEELSGEKSSSVPLQVFVRDANDNHPIFSKSVYVASIAENSGPGTSVLQVQARDLDSGEYGTEGIRFTSITGSIANMLHLNAISGLITIKSNGSFILDREVNSVFYLTVEARDSNGLGNRNTGIAQIMLDDENDESPVFLSSRYEGRLFENELEFVSPLRVKAIDNDLVNTPNSEVQYSIVAGNENKHFVIDKKTGIINVIKPLDFEKLPTINQNSNVKQVNFTTRANDLGRPPKFTLAQVKVFVFDVNDLVPTWKESSYKKIVRENAVSGTEIVQVVAFDSDGSSPFNRIVYRIERGDQDKFIIDADTGIIRLAMGASLDYNIKDHHVLEVWALDGGGLKSKTAAIVNISVVDVNNKAPKFIFNSDEEKNAGTFQAQVLENSPIGSYILSMKASDPDSRPLLRYDIDYNKSESRNDRGLIVKNVDLSAMFELQANDGVLKVSGNIDREIISKAVLKVTVEDIASANGKQLDTADIIVTINDDNDNAPQFSKNPYFGTIHENSKAGSRVIWIKAEDQDEDNIISYILHPDQADLDRLNFPLQISKSEGVITVSSKIDREKRDWLNFTVLARDSAVVPKESTTQVNIKVLDENDNSPKFVDSTSVVEVSEASPVGLEIAKVEAIDSDEGEFGQVSYRIDQSTSHGKFKINQQGVISVAEKLDREENASYILVVQAFDNFRYSTYSSGESRSDFKQVTIKIIDANDQVPEFDQESLKKVSVTEFHEGIITTVRASDADDINLPNSWVSFRIKKGNDLNLFKLEQGKNVAKLQPVRPLKAFFGNYTLVIEARDGGKPPNSAEAELHVEITDTNDSPPRFLFPRQNTTLKIAENSSVGSNVLQVRAVDDDINLNGLVRYKFRQDISGHWRHWEIHEISGVITLKESLDREKQKSYQLFIVAYDLGTPSLSSDLEIKILVQNVDDHKPQFNIKVFSVNFTENVAPFKEKFILPETIDLDDVDDDDKRPSQVCYFIKPDQQNSSKLFSLDPIHHFISTKVKLDRENRSTYSFDVVATDDCVQNIEHLEKKGAATLNVKVYVNDENDCKPRFIRKVFNGGVSTGTDFGTRFMNVIAEDLDLNDTISYSIIHPIMILVSDGLKNQVSNEALFEMDNSTGEISLGFDPQDNQKGHFLITVQAKDSAGHIDKAKVLVYLLNQNQKIKVVVRQNPAELRRHIEEFVKILSNVTGMVVTYDLSFKFHLNKDGSVDKTKTDFFIHLVEPEKNVVLDAPEALRLIDLNIEELDELFKEFNVVDTEATSLPLLPAKDLSENRNILLVYASGSAIFLTILLFVVVSLCFAQRSKFQRQLKAATANSYGTNSCCTNVPRIGNVPNTNMHSNDGSNPLWMQAYHNSWKEDSLSENSETRDSLDENAVSSSSPSSHLRSYVGSEKDIRRNDLNRTYHKNLLYTNRIDSNTCLILKKHLETTEL